MSLFGLFFALKTLILAFVHQQICMRIIKWSFHLFVSSDLEAFDPLLIVFPTSGYSQIFSNGQGIIRVRLEVFNPLKFCFRLITDFKMGLAEMFMEGIWTASPGPKEFLALLIRAKRRRRKKSSFAKLLGFIEEKLAKIWRILRPAQCQNSKNVISQSRKNVRAHYDLGNELFAQFLDPSFTYSSALFEDLEKAKTELALKFKSAVNLSEILFDAQMRKYDTILGELGQINAEQHILEIGCGWGAFAIRGTKKFACQWTGLTLSTEQLKLAQQRVRAEGLQNLVELKLLDYRHENGLYDHILAVEMIEAVGHEFLPQFFRICANRLKPGGKLCIQAILCRDELYERYRHSTDFIRRHIFPGGHLPSMEAIHAALPSNLAIKSARQMDEHYALTLDFWNNSWRQNKSRILELNPSLKFYKKWEMYFALCSVLFANHSIKVAQILIEKRANQC